MNILSAIGTGVKRLLRASPTQEKNGRREIDARSLLENATTKTGRRGAAMGILAELKTIYPLLSDRQKKAFFSSHPELAVEVKEIQDILVVFSA